MSEITRELLVRGVSKGKHSLAKGTTAREEKKEDDVQGRADLESGVSSLQNRSRFQDLPEGLAELPADRVFEDEDELEKNLNELKIADEPIVLGEDGKAYYHMPGEAHSTGTGHIARKFNSWARDMKGFAQENTNIKLGPRLPGAPPPLKRQRPQKRLPDVALWGRTTCYFYDDGRIRGAMRATPASVQPKVHPHVVIQLSVFNDEDYEVDAVNDLAARAVPGQGPPPNLIILIKSREANGPGIQAGFDIYYLPAGTFFDDAVNGTNGARHVVYNYGSPDVLVTIAEANLGGIDLGVWESIINFLKGRDNDFQLSMVDLCEVSFVS